MTEWERPQIASLRFWKAFTGGMQLAATHREGSGCHSLGKVFAQDAKLGREMIVNRCCEAFLARHKDRVAETQVLATGDASH
jgi:hypothetical protein